LVFPHSFSVKFYKCSHDVCYLLKEQLICHWWWIGPTTFSSKKQKLDLTALNKNDNYCLIVRSVEVVSGVGYLGAWWHHQGPSFYLSILPSLASCFYP
jgi:hypothetical protein